ncbi:hypothetical protein BRADI_3g15303v3 [Brachypodium distachyon]|uniref:Uncharacterized protein n=1 Tax=Brachypodium distachyon TaxID=15368 RepID=A0A2K2CXA1_BRADI|nr:hypothetical protein BRADI_3g15303v3 [Brachypodium distachyon]
MAEKKLSRMRISAEEEARETRRSSVSVDDKPGIPISRPSYVSLPPPPPGDHSPHPWSVPFEVHEASHGSVGRENRIPGEQGSLVV